MSEIVARKTRKLGPKWPNTVNRRMTKIGDSTKFAAAWTDADGNALASIEVGPLHGVAQIVGPQGTRHYGLVVGGAGFTLRRAYRAAWREMRVSAYNVRTLLRQRARLLRFARKVYDRMKRFEGTVERANARIADLEKQLDEARRAIISERTIDGFDINHWYRQASAAEARAQQWKNTVDRMIAEQGGATYKPVTVDASAEAAQEATS